MNAEQVAALKEMWTSAEKVWGTLKDISKRCATGDKAWKDAAANSPDWKGGYQRVLSVKEAVGPGIKAAEKIMDLASTSDKKLLKEKIENIVKDLKKYDKTIDEVDGDVAQYITWRRKFEKVVKMQLGGDPDIVILMKNLDRYLHERGLLNKELQSFQRLART